MKKNTVFMIVAGVVLMCPILSAMWLKSAMDKYKEPMKYVAFPEEIGKAQIGDTMVIKSEKDTYVFGFYHGEKLKGGESLVICNGWVQ